VNGGTRPLVAGVVIRMPATAKATPTEQAQIIELEAETSEGR